jgi:hypothetical protein
LARLDGLAWRLRRLWWKQRRVETRDAAGLAMDLRRQD